MDAMVTARMPQGKKEIGNGILEELGTNASSAINRLYDFVIEQKALPFDMPQKLSPEELERRIALVDGIPLASGNRFSTMDDDAIRHERLSKLFGA